MADDIHLSVKRATFGEVEIPKCTSVRLQLFDNDMFSRHFHRAHRRPILIFFWPSSGYGWRSTIWERMEDSDGKQDALGVVDENGRMLSVEARCKLWNDGPYPTLEFQFVGDSCLEAE